MFQSYLRGKDLLSHFLLHQTAAAAGAAAFGLSKQQPTPESKCECLWKTHFFFH